MTMFFQWLVPIRAGGVPCARFWLSLVDDCLASGLRILVP
jgi:hypothetical protein